MNYSLALLIILGTFALFYGASRLWSHRRQLALERTIANLPFPESWRTHLEATSHYLALSPEERQKIERQILRFLHTKTFKGIGLQVTDEMRAIVSFYAALMLLHKEGDEFAAFSTVLLYEEGFAAEQRYEEGGIVTEGLFELDGQSSDDTVALSWQDVRHEAYTLTPFNLVIHEFAHVLDFYNGFADGTPAMIAQDIGVLHDHYDRFVKQIETDTLQREFELFDDYAAEHEAEFFAIASERFFQMPRHLGEDLPRLYAALQRFYGVDARQWGVEAVPESARTDADE